jgi:hypothetical protein
LYSLKALAGETYATEKLKNYSDLMFREVRPKNFIQIQAIEKEEERSLLPYLANIKNLKKSSERSMMERILNDYRKFFELKQNDLDLVDDIPQYQQFIMDFALELIISEDATTDAGASAAGPNA